MREFWVSSGHHLLDRDGGGGLVVTDDFLKAYFARPEIMPPEDACVAERDLHARMMVAPRAPVTDGDIAAIVDADARENWHVVIAFRDHLLRHPTLEAAYLALLRDGTGQTPPLFVNQLVHVILRNALDDVEDAYVLRAAESFYRPQKLTPHDGTILLGDEETIGQFGEEAHQSPLIAMFGDATTVELDVLNDDNAARYFGRSDGHDMVLDFGTGRKGRQGFAEAVRLWVRHMLGVEVEVEPLPSIADEAWAWFVGLDAEATRIGNALWNGESLDAATLERVVALFRLTFADPAQMLPHVAGKPVYLIAAMTSDRIVRIKPQNLVMGLPVGQAAIAS
jgi:hypothetical protein